MLYSVANGAILYVAVKEARLCEEQDVGNLLRLEAALCLAVIYYMVKDPPAGAPSE